ncbi:hypothetical protein HBA55_09930 [Pseudomaricurvus alkylphenolicus]|uniref:hypothetical protein n=1 Tax=Pseudomaricurvus alkylphenolicus TaxID=1306991 RepID=UPI0014217D3D|nr:hypothetical protein [Pseudomaricurvus alkylphenolicus]NIB39905.1 hypothetical protein [Pseudomaricurvus alkylphenolicus]
MLTSTKGLPLLRDYFLLLTFLCTCSVTSANDTKTIRFVCEPTPQQSNYRLAQRFLGSVFQRLGYRYVQTHANVDDAIDQLRSGEADGDCGRLQGFTETNNLNNLATLRPAYGFASIAAWYTHLNRKPRSEQIAGYNANALMIETHLRKMGYQKIVPIQGQTEQIRQILSGEIDLFFNYGRAFDHLTLENFSPRIYRSDILVTLPIRPLIQKRYQELIHNWRRVARQVMQENQRRELPPVIDGDREILFGCSVAQQDRIFSELLPIYTEAFRRLNLNFRMVSLPRAREAHELARGNLDGTCARTLAFDTRRSDTVRIDVPLITTQLRIWSLDAQREIHSLEQITATDRVAMVRGTSYLEEKFKGFEGKLERLPNMITGLKMLASDHLDFLVGFEVAYMTTLGSDVIDVPIYSVGKLGEINIYPFLQRKNESLAPRLEQTLKAIITERRRQTLPQDLAPFR